MGKQSKGGAMAESIREVMTPDPATCAQARDEKSALADISAAAPNN